MPCHLPGLDFDYIAPGRGYSRRSPGPLQQLERQRVAVGVERLGRFRVHGHALYTSTGSGLKEDSTEASLWIWLAGTGLLTLPAMGNFLEIGL
jgi:hypothetical protein